MIFYKILLKTAKIACIFSIFFNFIGISNAKDKYLDRNFTIILRQNEHNLIAQHKDWAIYKVIKDNKKYCYALSRPISSESSLLKRAKPYFIVNDLINDADEIMVVSGFHFKENSDIEISFGARKYYLFAYETRGFAYSKNDDLDIIKSMQENAEFTISAYSKDNRITRDYYSLIGFKEAYFQLKKICKNG